MNNKIRFKVRYESAKNLLYSPLDSRVYVILALISLILLFYSIWEIKFVVVDITDFLGLASHLSLTYWLGYILILVCSFRLYLDIEHKNNLIYILFLMIFGLFLFSVPIFAEENARFPWSYYPAGEVKTILETKYIDLFSNYPLLSYREWPATHLISSSILYIANIKIETLLKYMPLYWVFSFILITFSIGIHLNLSEKQTFFVSFMALSSFWGGNYYYGPQSTVYILYLLFFMLIVTLSKTIKIRETILISLAFVVIVITHLLTSIAIFSSFFFSSIFIPSINEKRIKFILFFSIIFIAWYIYLAPVVLEVGIKEVISQMTKPEMLGFIQTDKYSIGELLTRQITHYSRINYIGIYAISMIAAIGLYLSKRIEKEYKGLIKISFIWLFSLLLLFLFKYGESEIDDRIYMFALIPMGLIIVLSFNRKILIVIAAFLIVPHITAHYGTESFEMARTTELRGAEFFAKYINTDRNPYEPYSYYFSTYIQFYDPKKIFMEWRSFTGDYPPNISKIDTATYIVNSRGSSNFMLYAIGFDPVQNWIQFNQGNINSFYDNGYFKIYKKIL